MSGSNYAFSSLRLDHLAGFWLSTVADDAGQQHTDLFIAAPFTTSQSRDTSHGRIVIAADLRKSLRAFPAQVGQDYANINGQLGEYRFPPCVGPEAGANGSTTKRVTRIADVSRNGAKNTPERVVLLQPTP